ncbi:MAG: hypothetical protein H8E80_07720 [Desulfobacteraceae bacterium]|uniref:Uncharacterized protein n=1 Tax=Candidatus Desulfaltia bathyphila TaxID=2841697 RepID=A0A8J6N458_9BACT|nr:hypothetical protein [Candidatus Desulfaltia bathyphila]MBL7195279.1 hypothetical protein [Desulfobacterales bacterium]
MKPIYFPFTYIFDLSAETISSIFGQTVIYRPSSKNLPEMMQESAKRGAIDIRIPVKKDESKLNAALKDYKSWLNLHLGDKRGMTAFFKTQADKIPFFDDTITAQIRADIKKKTQQKQPETKPDTLFNARIFLAIAQEFDAQNWEINQKLFMVDELQQKLIENIKGEIDSSYIKNAENNLHKSYDPESYDQGAYMTADRIKAWALLMQHDQQGSGLFITDSKSAFECLIDKASQSEIIVGFDSMPLQKNSAGKADKRRDNFMKQLEIIAKNPWPTSTDKIVNPPFTKNSDAKVSLTLAIVPGKTPHEFFAGCCGYNLTESKEKSRFQNTLLGLVEPF